MKEPNTNKRMYRLNWSRKQRTISTKTTWSNQPIFEQGRTETENAGQLRAVFYRHNEYFERAHALFVRYCNSNERRIWWYPGRNLGYQGGVNNFNCNLALCFCNGKLRSMIQDRRTIYKYFGCWRFSYLKIHICRLLIAVPKSPYCYEKMMRSLVLNAWRFLVYHTQKQKQETAKYTKIK